MNDYSKQSANVIRAFFFMLYTVIIIALVYFLNTVYSHIAQAMTLLTK